MDESWYKDFTKSTGFAPSKQEQARGPVSKARVKAAADFASVYGNANRSPPPPSTVPNTLRNERAVLPGRLPTGDSLEPTRFRSPYPPNELINETDGSQQHYPTEQKNWTTPGIWKSQKPGLENRPASGPIPGSRPRGGFEVFDKGPPRSLATEKMTGASSPETLKTAAICTAGGAILAAGLYVGAGNQQDCERARSNQRKLVFVGGALLIVTIVLAGVYSQSGPERQQGEYYGKGRKVLMDTNFAPPVYPLQADQPLYKPYPRVPDPEDSIETRYRKQGLNTGRLEGPRADVGYQRGAPTPDGRNGLQATQLMRQPGNYNMDTGTFDEYMRRLNGEAPTQVVQSQPYYTFNADWDMRGRIDDPEKYFAIGGQPNQMLRKAIQRDSKIDQAGAKRMHLKDPPPGAVQPLGKVHPWMETNESGMQPAFLAGVGQSEKQEGAKEPYTRPDVGVPESPRVKIIEEREGNGGDLDMRDLLNERMVRFPPAAVQPGFLDSEETATDKKKNIAKAQGGDTGMPPTSMELKNGLEAPKYDAGPQQPLEVPRVKMAPEKNLESYGGIHGDGADGGTIQGNGQSDDDFFASQFAEPALPSQQVIDAALASKNAR